MLVDREVVWRRSFGEFFEIPVVTAVCGLQALAGGGYGGGVKSYRYWCGGCWWAAVGGGRCRSSIKSKWMVER